uniref:RNase H type-1 domain-containing protein n=1 Tax=Lutzomyia longipalpis TaxID=7200 RepID=A0A1B0CSL5_LUTLO
MFRGALLNVIYDVPGHVYMYTTPAKANKPPPAVAVGKSLHKCSRRRRPHRTTEEEYSVSTSGLVSIFSAEAKAVHHALSVASPHQGRTAILTDSLSVVQALGGSDNHHPTITNIKMLVYSNPHDTRIVWIPGHCGIAGNEKADELAGDAASKRTVEDISVPLVDLQRRCKEKLI